MKDVSQTKEGFIKSMILFVVLLGICFAPFFAFSQQATPVSQSLSSVHLVEPGLSFDLNFESNQAQIKFQTKSNCQSYAVEGKMAGSNQWVEIFYCHDARCMDASEGIEFSFWIVEYPYDVFRVKIANRKGEFNYSQEKQIKKQEPEIELINSAVNDKLFLNLHTNQNFTYSIMSTNGKLLNANLSSSGSEIDLSHWKAGFYIITFKTAEGQEYHYTFLKQ